MPNSDSNAQLTTSAPTCHNTMLAAAYFVRKCSYFFWHYFVNTPCFLFHELCHFATLLVLLPFLKINKIDYSIDYKFDLWHYSITVDFGSKYKTIRFLVITAPIIGSIILYVYFFLNIPILAILVVFLINFSKLGLSEIDKNSLRDLFIK